MRFLLRLFSSRNPHEENNLAITILHITGQAPKNITYYTLAFRHRSADKDQGALKNNDRLEFLGDAILSAVVAEFLYKQYPERDEGFLTSMRSKIVSRKNLNTIATILGIDRLIIANLDNRKIAKSINGDALEALVGAVYLDLGMIAASAFINTKILNQHHIFSELESQIISYKSKLLEWSQKERKSLSFGLLDSWGLDHDKTFEMGVYIDKQLICSGKGQSKKLAEEAASIEALQSLDLLT